MGSNAFPMFVFYRLLHRCVNAAPSSTPTSIPQESSIPSLDPAKDRAVLLWYTVFGASLLFRPIAEFVIRILLFALCTLLIGTLDGLFNLLIGHAVLRAAKYGGYDPPLLSSIEAGSLGGIIVTGPTTFVTACLIALLGGLKLQRALSVHIAFLLEAASVIAVSTAACPLGVTIVRHIHPHDGIPLDATHAARAGAVGACILTVPVVSTAAFLMRAAQTVPSVRNELIAPLPPRLAENLVYAVNDAESSPRTRRHVIARTSVETVGYVLVTLCILTIRLLCF